MQLAAPVAGAGGGSPTERPIAFAFSGMAVARAFNPPVDIDRVVYGTITMMCVLIVYDGWGKTDLAEVFGVIAGPIIAMFVAHVFAHLIAKQAASDRTLHSAECVNTIRRESRFLLLAVPAATWTVVLSVAGVSLTTCIQTVLWLGVASLGYWAGLAAHRAGLTGWHLTMAVVAGVIVGLLVLGIQVLLDPGGWTLIS